MKTPRKVLAYAARLDKIASDVEANFPNYNMTRKQAEGFVYQLDSLADRMMEANGIDPTYLYAEVLERDLDEPELETFSDPDVLESDPTEDDRVIQELQDASNSDEMTNPLEGDLGPSVHAGLDDHEWVYDHSWIYAGDDEEDDEDDEALEAAWIYADDEEDDDDEALEAAWIYAGDDEEDDEDEALEASWIYADDDDEDDSWVYADDDEDEDDDMVSEASLLEDLALIRRRASQARRKASQGTRRGSKPRRKARGAWPF